jgi:hypothetical protein
MCDDTLPTIEVLEEALLTHRWELRQLQRMTDHQFQCFRANFLIGALEMSRGEAMQLLANMIATNIRMQRMQKSEK